ncbi:hypothetical protein SCALIN_C13_0065 [Candidatus Scalindua japonica]|uniref:Uncharacterized protein n=1 Tax=Candidatus Scalindua japonica TaxID=1284222 RepID=A0A286TXD6_9BACT|nr:hypothetical protein [Candidatus Scalindua japonica]GAX60553.1 hypothetical protein SCALIN_C13_0065 [Candidatus Scalindua japonica]
MAKEHKTNYKNKELSPIVNKLLECCEKRQSVFLYGDLLADDHENLMSKIRDMWARVYLKGGEGPYFWELIDCEFMNGEGVYNELAGRVDNNGVLLRDGLLFRCDGLIFLDNLHCRNNEDVENYINLAKIIAEHNGISKNKHLTTIFKDGKHLSQSVFEKNVYVSSPLPTIFEWLVVYTYNDLNDFPKPFPKPFLKQFKLISLDGGDAKEAGSEEELVDDLAQYKNSPLYKKTPKNAKWQDLTMAFPNHLEDKVGIIFKSTEKDTVSLKDLGFVDKKATRTFKPLESLVLLKRIANDNNKYSFPLGTDSERGTLNAQITSLRNVLRQCFGIDGDPVPANEKGGYRLLFKAYCYDLKEKQEVDTYLDSLKEYFTELKSEVSNTGVRRDKDKIKELKEAIQVVTKEITQRIPNMTIENVICFECDQNISIYKLVSDNTQILCSKCMPETASEYESKSVIDYKDNDISRS